MIVNILSPQTSLVVGEFNQDMPGVQYWKVMPGNNKFFPGKVRHEGVAERGQTMWRDFDGRWILEAYFITSNPTTKNSVYYLMSMEHVAEWFKISGYWTELADTLVQEIEKGAKYDKGIHINVRVTPMLKETIKVRAGDMGMTVSDWVRATILEKLENE